MEDSLASEPSSGDLLCKNGEWKWILARGKTVSRSEDGKALRVVGSHADITECKRMENALRRSEEDYADLYNNAPDMFVSVDLAAKTIVQCSEFH
jgi:PAS domain-containing protein